MAAPKFKSLAVAHEASAICELYRGDLHIGDFVCRYINTAGATFLLARARRNRRLTPAEQRRLANPKSEDDVIWARRKAIELLLDQEGLTDWKLEDTDGKPVRFSRENAILLFTQPGYEWVYNEVENFATAPENFPPSAETVAGE